MLFFRFPRRLIFTQIFTNKEKVIHLVCACVFLYMIRELKNKDNCKTVSNAQHEFTKIIQTPSRTKVRNDIAVDKEDKKDSNEKEVKDIKKELKKNDKKIKTKPKKEVGKVTLSTLSHFKFMSSYHKTLLIKAA